MTDFELVERYLKKCRSFGLSMRYGGLRWMLDEGSEALEALGRLMQPGFQWEPREAEIDRGEEQRTHAA